MAHITKLDNGKYKAVVEISNNSYERKRKTKTFVKESDAQLWLSRAITDLADGIFIDPEKILFNDFVDRWLDSKKPNIAATTYDRYRNRLEAHMKPFFKGITLQDIKPFHLEEYFSIKRREGRKDGKEGGLSENTLKKHYVIINNVFKKAIKLKMIKYNPVKSIDSPKVKKKKAPVMSGVEFNKLLDVIKEDLFMFTFVLTDFFTGMRRSEILGLEWEDINLEEGIIHVRKRLVTVKGGIKHEEKTKTESSNRKIKISDKLISVLNKYRKEKLRLRLSLGDEYNDSKDFVFCRPDGKPYYPKFYNDKLNSYLDKAGLPQKYTIHTLRHTFATINLKNKIEPKIIQEMLGHSTISTTLDIYSHVDTNMQKEAVNKMDKMINF